MRHGFTEPSSPPSATTRPNTAVRSRRKNREGRVAPNTAAEAPPSNHQCVGEESLLSLLLRVQRTGEELTLIPTAVASPLPERVTAAATQKGKNAHVELCHRQTPLPSHPLPSSMLLRRRKNRAFQLLFMETVVHDPAAANGAGNRGAHNSARRMGNGDGEAITATLFRYRCLLSDHREEPPRRPTSAMAEACPRPSRMLNWTPSFAARAWSYCHRSPTPTAIAANHGRSSIIVVKLREGESRAEHRRRGPTVEPPMRRGRGLALIAASRKKNGRRADADSYRCCIALTGTRDRRRYAEGEKRPRRALPPPNAVTEPSIAVIHAARHRKNRAFQLLFMEAVVRNPAAANGAGNRGAHNSARRMGNGDGEAITTTLFRYRCLL
nr:hypothetical protein Iba_chr13fCG6060 [Ipomoea batatas]